MQQFDTVLISQTRLTNIWYWLVLVVWKNRSGTLESHRISKAILGPPCNSQPKIDSHFLWKASDTWAHLPVRIPSRHVRSAPSRCHGKPATQDLADSARRSQHLSWPPHRYDLRQWQPRWPRCWRICANHPPSNPCKETPHFAPAHLSFWLQCPWDLCWYPQISPSWTCWPELRWYIRDTHPVPVPSCWHQYRRSAQPNAVCTSGTSWCWPVFFCPVFSSFLDLLKQLFETNSKLFMTSELPKCHLHTTSGTISGPEFCGRLWEGRCLVDQGLCRLQTCGLGNGCRVAPGHPGQGRQGCHGEFLVTSGEFSWFHPLNDSKKHQETPKNQKTPKVRLKWRMLLNNWTHACKTLVGTRPKKLLVTAY